MDINTATELVALVDEAELDGVAEEDGPPPPAAGLSSARCRELVGHTVELTTCQIEVEILAVNRLGVQILVGELKTYRSGSSLALIKGKKYPEPGLHLAAGDEAA